MPKTRLGCCWHHCSTGLLSAPKAGLQGGSLLAAVREERRDMVRVHEEAPQQWNFPAVFQVPSHLQVKPVQNIHFCCFLNPWWRETGINTQSVTGSHPHRRNKYLSEQTGIAVWILNKFEYFKNHFSLSLVFTANEEVFCFVSLKWVDSF